MTARSPWPPIIDAHHHVWDLASTPQPWMDDATRRAIGRDYSMADYRDVLPRDDILSILVQTVASDDETAEMLELAWRTPTVVGVIGWADVTAPDLHRQLTRLKAGPGGHKLCGIRSLVYDEPDPQWIERPDVVRGLTAVRDHGLVFDLLVRPEHFPSLLRVIDDLPGLGLVIDHLGRPPVTGGDPTAWREGLAALALRSQIACKISGLVSESDWRNGGRSEYRTWLEHVASEFGPNRLIFGSDWPVSEVAGGWPAAWSVVEELLAMIAPSARPAVLGLNALRTYRLRLPVQWER